MYRPYLVWIVRKVGHGSGQTALCSQYAGVAGQLLCQNVALDGHLAVTETLDWLTQHHNFFNKILNIEKQ